MADDFAQTITTAYATDGAALDLGRSVHDGAVVAGATVKLPLRMVNRHGLIAGATGTGKTKSLQGIAEQLSSAGVPVFVADVKGDLSGVAAKRAQELGPVRPKQAAAPHRQPAAAHKEAAGAMAGGRGAGTSI